MYIYIYTYIIHEYLSHFLCEKNQYFWLKNKQFSIDIFPIFTVFFIHLSVSKIMLLATFALCLMFNNKFSICKKYFS